MRILLTGAAGHLGAALVRRLSGRHALSAFTRRELDVCDPDAVNRAVRNVRPDAIVNCAAFTDVDGAEDDPVAALEVNAVAVRTLAAAAAASAAALVHYSTDFVFDGTASRPYMESDAPNPRSTYACSKLIGEWFAAGVPRHYVLRVESLFGVVPASPSGRRTSIDQIVDAVEAGAESRVFTDRFITPSYMPDVGYATEALLEREGPCGLYHCVNSGACSFLELAEEVARQLGTTPRLLPVKMEAQGLRAQRPRFCVLSNERLQRLGIPMPSWQDAVSRHLADRHATRGA